MMTEVNLNSRSRGGWYLPGVTMGKLEIGIPNH
jgi:hypothetical protein